METPTYKEFQKWYQKQTGLVVKDSISQRKEKLGKVEGFFEDVDGFEDNVKTRAKEIEMDMVDNVLL